ncbi:unnamed protein product [Absidia cylindrospora]
MAKVYTSSQVASHTSADSCWIIYNGKVYDVTEFILDHPGGDDLILDYAGKDVTANTNILNLLMKFWATIVLALLMTA